MITYRPDRSWSDSLGDGSGASLTASEVEWDAIALTVPTVKL